MRLVGFFTLGEGRYLTTKARLATFHEFDSQSVRLDESALETGAGVERFDEDLVALHCFREIVAFVSDVRLLLENFRERTSVLKV